MMDMQQPARERYTYMGRLAWIDTPETWLFRPLTKGDAFALSKLMFEAYQGTIDDMGETYTDAVEEVRAIFEGKKYGEVIQGGTFTIEGEDGDLQAAVITTNSPDFDAPLIAFLMVHPDHQSQGMGHYILSVAMESMVKNGGVERAYAVITAGNEPSERLFERVGFERLIEE